MRSRRPPSIFGRPALFRDIQRQKTLKPVRCQRKAHRVISAGHSAVVDAVYADTNERSAITAIAASRKVEFHALFLTADLATRVSRVSARVGDALDADVAVAQHQERYALSDLSWTRIDASGSPTQTLERARHVLFDQPNCI